MASVPWARGARRRQIRKDWYRQLYVWVLIAMASGAVFGLVTPDVAVELKPIGEAFVDLLTMVIGPIVFCMVVGGVASAGSMKRLGGVAGRSLIYFEIVTTIALLLGLLAVNLIQPGAGMNADADDLEVSEKVQSSIEAGGQLHWYDYILQVIPSNIVEAFAENLILQILVFSVLFAAALLAMGDTGRQIAGSITRVGDALFKVVQIVMWVAPVGVFGAMAYTVGNYGAATLGALAALVGTFYLTSLIFVLVVLGGILAAIGLKPFLVWRYLKDEILLALGASSSEVALPGIVRKLEAAGVPKSTAGVTVGAGYSFNLDGTSIYLTLSTVFIAQALGIDLTLEQQLVMIGTMLLTSKGTAGVTGGGFVMLTTTVSSLSFIPTAGVMLVLGIDRFMSECRAVVNSLGNAVAGLVVARWQREIDPSDVCARMADYIASGRDSAPATPAEDTTPHDRVGSLQ
ncbi:cation:dicarboxylase symporter family transporter [Rhodococcus sp. ABRD24]|uniref:cation:dicarboxylate symporter family transporter n=1 Tax=Rhodococcus sp. ABRD24 TaxID=2507582 RepID=UPI00103BBE92|nr:cation:dicarboxylase symporter family transporter [Rhodococcus sp. ABRD24]QBJ97088.1 cation:dicarboxylase symporter family transporter [Rhodococcus sp. ABRD24]